MATEVGIISGYAPLLVVYVILGVGAWTWALAAPHRTGRRHSDESLERRQRRVRLVGAGVTAGILVLAMASKLIDGRGLALVLGLLAMTTQLTLIMLFTAEGPGPAISEPVADHDGLLRRRRVRRRF
jgi:hypothetical protein